MLIGWLIWAWEFQFGRPKSKWACSTKKNSEYLDSSKSPIRFYKQKWLIWNNYINVFSLAKREVRFLSTFPLDVFYSLDETCYAKFWTRSSHFFLNMICKTNFLTLYSSIFVNFLLISIVNDLEDELLQLLLRFFFING